MKCPSTFSCPVEATLDLIGGKYKALILWHLIDNTLRFNEIGKLIPKATPKMLTQQLRELENDNLDYSESLSCCAAKGRIFSSATLGEASFLFWMRCVNGEKTTGRMQARK